MPRDDQYPQENPGRTYEYIRTAVPEAILTVDRADYRKNRALVDSLMSEWELDQRVAAFFVRFSAEAQAEGRDALFVERGLARLQQELLTDYGPSGAGWRYTKMLGALLDVNVLTPREVADYREIFLERVKNGPPSAPSRAPSPAAVPRPEFPAESAPRRRAASGRKGRSASGFGTAVFLGAVILALALLVLARRSGPVESGPAQTPGQAVSVPAGKPGSSAASAEPEATEEPAAVRSFEWKDTASASLTTRIGYDSENKVLAVTFRDSGETYYYLNVPESVWKDFRSAASISRYFEGYIRDRYKFEVE